MAFRSYATLRPFKKFLVSLAQAKGSISKVEAEALDQLRPFLDHPKRGALLRKMLDTLHAIDSGEAVFRFYQEAQNRLTGAEKRLLLESTFEAFDKQSIAEKAARRTPKTAPHLIPPSGPRRIVTLTANPVLDLSLKVTDQSFQFEYHPGGKGLNISVGAEGWAMPTQSFAFLGGAEAKLMRTLFADKGVSDEQFVSIEGSTRLGLNVTSPSGEEVLLFTDSPSVSESNRYTLVAHLRQALREGDQLVISGSLPEGIEPTFYAELITIAKQLGIRTYLDTRGAALTESLKASPYFIGVNLDEFAAHHHLSANDYRWNSSRLLADAQALLGNGTERICISDGANGMILVTPEGSWWASPPSMEIASTVGAGDTIKLAFLYAEQQGWSPLEALRLATAASAVTVSRPGTEIARLEDARARMPDVCIIPLFDVQKTDALKKQMREAAEAHDEKAFLRWAEAWENATGGEVVAVALAEVEDWSPLPVLTGAPLDEWIVRQQSRFSAPYNRGLIRKSIDGVLFGLGKPGEPAVGFICVEDRLISTGLDRLEPVYHLTSLMHPQNYLYFPGMGGGDENWTPYMGVDGAGQYYELTILRDQRGDHHPSETGVIEHLVGFAGSFSRVDRIEWKGGTAIRKTVLNDVDGGKLRAEAHYLKELSERAIPGFPKIYLIEETADVMTLILEDLRGYPITSLYYWNSGFWEAVSWSEIWRFTLEIFKRFVPVFYTTRVSETPADFLDKFHLDRIVPRLEALAASHPNLARLFNAEWLWMNRDETEGKLIPGWPTLLRFLRELAPTGVLNPPYLSELHGDLNEGNVLLDLLEYARDGRFSTFKTFDVKHHKTGHDYLYDLAKLIHGFFGFYVIGRMDQVYGFEESRTIPLPANFYAISEFWDDEFGNLSPLYATTRMTHLFMDWLGETEDLFGLEQGDGWKMRLLVTHALIMIGLPHFHIRNDDVEGRTHTFFIKGIDQLYGTLNALFMSAHSLLPQTALVDRLKKEWRELLVEQGVNAFVMRDYIQELHAAG